MENTKKITEVIQPILDKNDVQLYEIVWMSNEKNLQISIMKKNGSIDLDTCAVVSEQISEALDTLNTITEEYTLEVCSPGAEREIKDLDELDTMQGAYVFVQFKQAVKSMTEVTGEITAIDNGVITLSYRDKAAKRSLEFSKENIHFIRMAVKF